MAQEKKLFCGSSIARTRLSLALGVIVAALAVLAAGCSQSEDAVAGGSGSAASTSQTSLSSVTSPSPAAENTTTSTSLPVLDTTATQAPEEPSSSSSKITTTTTTSLVPVEAEATLPEETVPESTPPEETVPDTTLPEETVPETTLPEETVPETTIPEETAVEVASPEETEAESSLPEKALEIISGRISISSSGSPLSVSLNPVHSRNFLVPPSWIEKDPNALSSLMTTPGDYLLELLDASDSVLRSISFEAGEIEITCEDGPCPESAEPSTALFGFHINDSPDYSKLRFSKQGNVFDTITRSASTPSIYDLVVSVPEAQSDNEEILLTWSATDDDNDDLLFVVFYISDSRGPLRVSSFRTDATSMNISLDLLRGSNTARIAVSVSDGLRTAFIESEIFSVPNKPPDASIEGSTDSTISGSQSLVLSASGYDREDGNLPSVAFSWRSNIDGDLGVGRFIVVSGDDLTAGEHEITMTATDSAGNQVTDRIRITVNK